MVEKVEARFHLQTRRESKDASVLVLVSKARGEWRDSPGSLAGSLNLNITAKRGKWLKKARDISSAE